jgi:hypothetical protein
MARNPSGPELRWLGNPEWCGAAPRTTLEPVAVSPSPQLGQTPPGGPAGFEDLRDPDEPGSPRSRRRNLGTIAAVVTCVLIVGMWAFVYIWGAVQKPVDRLSDPSFGRRGEPICQLTAGQLAALPAAQTSKTNVDRAAVVAQSNVDLRSMLAKLREIAPTSGQDSSMVHSWLADYSTYVANREDYARRLAKDPNARFYENQKEPGEQISEPVDTFATANHMDDCATPGDLS